MESYADEKIIKRENKLKTFFSKLFKLIFKNDCLPNFCDEPNFDLVKKKKPLKEGIGVRI